MVPEPVSDVRVRHVPAAHPYVEHVHALPSTASAPAVAVLPDPPVPGAPPGQWWPHPALEEAWVREHAHEQDVLHVHFGVEGRSLPELRAWLDALADLGLPLVHTVHDVDHPHLHDQRHHREQLALLVERADGLLTLSEGAAQRVEREHGRRPLVLPHPHVVPMDLLDRPRPVHEELRIGMHLKSLRTNVTPMRVLPALLEAVPHLAARTGRPAVLEIRAHPEVLDPDFTRHDEALARLLRRLLDDPPPGVEVLVGPRLDDEQLWAALQAVDVSVLPYAWATHSGWVEACRDLGTWVLSPEVGHLEEQGAGMVIAWGPPHQAPIPSRLVDLLALCAAGPPARPGAQARAAQRAELARRHAQVYAGVIDGRRIDGGSPP